MLDSLGYLLPILPVEHHTLLILSVRVISAAVLWGDLRFFGLGFLESFHLGTNFSECFSPFHRKTVELRASSLSSFSFLELSIPRADQVFSTEHWGESEITTDNQ